ncbi:DUF3488 and transglutaminase-like domain-containing protein [Actinokineospora fastidiosa]|uniref:Transglutaminase-like domain-containing protein n=1 Tax=Actinokineospora fastidiosa TaxID=1816 RepID=A0A918GUT3_9PSEU|nr:DUF3488 and transglutaminase-like domain-containing protein [Actinokineospora fastidiosa]GGS60114.1 hypothetical protein GCM10010171_63790 [Actinokineospora fastidiosa]
MRTRVAVGCVLLAAAWAGLLFAPVFGVGPLVVPIIAVVAVVYAVFELCARVPVLVPWRPVVALAAGLLAVVETVLWDTTAAGVPTAATVRALSAGLAESWQLTLQSTWPARDDPELLLFVPLAVLAAAVLGVEALRRPLLAVLPSLAVVALSQAYQAADGVAATVSALAYAVVVATLLGVTSGSWSARRSLVVVPTFVFALAGALLAGVLDPLDREPYRLQADRGVVPPVRTVSPLAELAGRLIDPDEPVFTYTATHPVDRWRTAVYDRFDGGTWTASPDYRRMGAELDPRVDGPVVERSADVEVPEPEGELPSQPLPVAVSGVAPLVDEDSGMLLVPGADRALAYRLTWREPAVDATALLAAAVDADAADRIPEQGPVPAGAAEWAREAVGDLRPTFQTALALEEYFREGFRLARGADLPTGSAWRHLEEFRRVKRGTSEQFAAAYVVLARALGIPARLVVGYRGAAEAGTVTVRNGDVLAWPEVAVEGVGWVPLDPTRSARTTAGGPGLAAAAERAREVLPPASELPEPQLEPTPVAEAEEPGGAFPVLPVVLALGALLLLALLAMPVAAAVRRWRRRRMGVPGAWLEARDLIRACGVPTTPGMTVRDLARTAPDQSLVDALHELAAIVDEALWSGRPGEHTARAWAVVRRIRRGLPAPARMRAALRP